MKRRFAKFVSLMLVLMMVFGLIPASVLAGPQTIEDADRIGDRISNWWEIIVHPLPWYKPTPNYPAQSFGGDELGGLYVNVEAPEGALPEGTEMYVERVYNTSNIQTAIDESSLVDGSVIAAVDITFYHDGVEFQPGRDVRVTLSYSAFDGRDDLSVVHIGASAEEVLESVPFVDPVEDVESEGETVSFDASDFSVYAVVGGEGGDDNTVTINFYTRKNNASGPSSNANDWEIINKQIVRYGQLSACDPTGNPPSYAITDPGVPSMTTSQSFEGWTTDKNFAAGTKGVSVQQINVDEKAAVADGTIQQELNFYAMVYDVVYITYHDQAGAVLETEANHVVFNADGTATLNKVFERPYTPFKGDQKFFGWIPESYVVDKGDYPTYTAGAEEHYFVSDGTVTTTLQYSSETNNLDVYPYLAEGHWLIFDTNIAVNNAANHNNFDDPTSAEYTAPILFMSTETTMSESEAPHPNRTGYTFGGWYSDPEMTRAFTWGNKLTKDTTVYAKWSKASTTVRVVFWTQQASDSPTATNANKKYDYYDSYTVNVTTGDTFNLPSGTTSLATSSFTAGGKTIEKLGQFFEYNATNTNQSVVVKGDGLTTLNVRYDRKVVTIKFYSSTYTTYYSGYTYSYAHGHYYYDEDLLYTRTGLYGADLNDWPAAGSGYRWYWYYSDSNTYSMSLSEWNSYRVFNSDSTGETEWYLHRATFSASSPKYIYFIGQDTSGNYNQTLATSVLGSGSSILFDSTLFLGFTCYGYNTSTNATSGSSFTAATSGQLYYSQSYGTPYISGNAGSSAYIFYKRNSFDFYFNSNGTNYTLNIGGGNGYQGNGAKIYYGTEFSDLSGFADFVPTNGPKGYYFDGWYKDPNFNEKFDFSGSMPNNAVTVYAKWTMTRFRVVLDYGTSDDIIFPGNKQADSFRLDYEEQVRDGAIMAAEREGYTLLGWYYRENGNGEEKEFNFAMGATESMADMSYANASAEERQGDYKVQGLIDSNGNTMTHWTDADGTHDNVRGKIVIYAKWRVDPEGVIGVHVKYYADNDPDKGYFGNDTSVNIWDDPYIYVDLAEAYAQPASTPKTQGQQFLYWEILDKDGNPTGRRAYPGQTWEVLLGDAKLVKTQLPDPRCDHSYERTHHDAVEATCETAGSVEYWECDNCHKKFDAETGGNIITDVTVPALGHQWGTPTYTWDPSSDLPVNGTVTCTGTATCTRDSSHTATETVTAVWTVDTPATTSSTGIGHYAATFTNDAFTAQNSDSVVIPVITGYVVHFSAPDGVTVPDQVVEPGDPVTLPTGLADVNGWSFVGWIENTLAETSTQPTVLSSYTPTTAESTLYAVYSGSVATGSVTYQLVESLENGGKYIIVDSNSISGTTGYAVGNTNMSNYGHYLTPVSVTISGNTCTATSANLPTVLWQAASVSGGYTFYNTDAGKYMGYDSEYICVSDTAHAWAYASDKYLNDQTDSEGYYYLSYGSKTSGYSTVYVYTTSKNGSIINLYKETPVTETHYATTVPGGGQSGTTTWTTSPSAKGNAVTEPTAPASRIDSKPMRETTTTTVGSWNFETSTDYSDWAIVDNDGDGYNWSRTSTNTTVHSGSYALRSNSYYSSTALTPDNWVFTGAVSIPADGTTTMTFWMRAQDQKWPGDIIRVYANSTASITGATPLTDDTPTVATEENDGWVQITVDLTAYAGQTIYIGFRHYNSSDLFAVVVDDVEIVNVVTTETEYYTVTLIDHDGSEIGKIENIEDGTTINEPAEPEREDYYFVSWQLNGEDFDFNTPITGNITLVATYTPMYSYEYTVSLRAVYGMVNTDAKTHIYWYANNDPTKHGGAGERYVSTDSTGSTRIDINDQVPIPAPTGNGNSNLVTFFGDGSIGTLTYKENLFLGWARMEASGSGIEGEAHPELNEDDVYLRWDPSAKKFYANKGTKENPIWVETSKVYADETTPYHDMYAVWATVFYIYHSGTGEVEKIVRTTKDGATYDLTQNIDIDPNDGNGKCFLYGGYYTDYFGKSTGFDVHKEGFFTEATFSWNNSGLVKSNWYQTNNDEDGVKYAGDTDTWNESGTAYTKYAKEMTPEAGAVYYIKEVPAENYLKPYIYYTYTLATGDIQTLWTISDIDDNNYKQTGFVIVNENKEAKVCKSLTIHTSSGNSTVKLTTKRVFGVAGYLTYLMVVDPSFDENLLTAGANNHVLQYWVTPDGCIVTGIYDRTYSDLSNINNIGSIGNGITETKVESTIGKFTEQPSSSL